MSPELEKKLVEKYPAIFKNRYGNVRETAMCWGFEHGDGWYHIIDNLCAMLYQDYNQAKQQYEFARNREASGKKDYRGVLTDAIEVERARLKMKAAYDAIPVAVQVKEKFGTLRFYINCGNDRAYDLINFAELMSGVTCEVCGNVGRRRYGGWIGTLCDHHAKEMGYKDFESTDDEQ